MDSHQRTSSCVTISSRAYPTVCGKDYYHSGQVSRYTPTDTCVEAAANQNHQHNPRKRGGPGLTFTALARPCEVMSLPKFSAPPSARYRTHCTPRCGVCPSIGYHLYFPRCGLTVQILRRPAMQGRCSDRKGASDAHLRMTTSDRDEVPPILAPPRSPMRPTPPMTTNKSARMSIADSTTGQSIASSK